VGTYVDTSALVKRYVHEPSSMAFDDFVAATDDEFLLSTLTLVELQSVLTRRLRQGDFDRVYLKRLRGLFDSDLRAALWIVMPFPIGASPPQTASRLAQRSVAACPSTTFRPETPHA
jgi:predicted nucleic acid-binding protein